MNEDLKYKDPNYWNERYKTEECYEWFHPYNFFQPIIRRHVNPTDNILVLGCGNSSLSEDMYRDGFERIVNIDNSTVVIEKMRQKSDICSKMEWQVADIKKMDFLSASFDVILEKGTLDAMLVGEKDPWNLSQETCDVMDQILEETSRILKRGGRFLSISFRQPHFQRKLLDKAKFQWSFNYTTVGESFHYFVYEMIKNDET